MLQSVVRSAARKIAPLAMGATALGSALFSAPPVAAGVVFHPGFSDIQLVKAGEVPPTQAQCNAISRRCFNPTAEQNSYNLTPLLASGHQGQGQTIIIVDAFGSETMRHDLKVFDNAFGLPHMCGEEGTLAGCSGPTFSEFQQGNTSTNPLPGTSRSPGQEDRSAWAIEVALDVEWAHTMAPMANILLVTTPTAETLGVQGFPDFMKAEATVIAQHRGSVISQSFASTEEAFNGGTAALQNLRYAFQAAQANRVTVFASSGDFGSAGLLKTPVHAGGTLLPFPAVWWPASDPLVTGVGGTYECTNASTGVGVDSVSPPSNCRSYPGVREIGWIDAGGGFSHVFAKPSFQNTLPPGSTAIGSMRGVPDIGLQASSRTGVLIYITNPGYSTNVNDSGWYVIGGTSSSSPQWAGLIAVANEMSTSGGGKQLGYINPALYAIAANPAMYASDFYDVTTGNNAAFAPAVAGYNATTGWDPVTGLGTPNAANLLPDLIAYVNSH